MCSLAQRLGFNGLGRRAGLGRRGIGRGGWDLSGQLGLRGTSGAIVRLLQEIHPATPGGSGAGLWQEVGVSEKRQIGGES